MFTRLPRLSLRVGLILLLLIGAALSPLGSAALGQSVEGSGRKLWDLTVTSAATFLNGKLAFREPTGASITSNYVNLTATIPAMSAQFRAFTYDLTLPSSQTQTARHTMLRFNPAAVPGSGASVLLELNNDSQNTTNTFGLTVAINNSTHPGNAYSNAIEGNAEGAVINVGAHGMSTDTFTGANVGVRGTAEGGTTFAGGLFEIGIDGVNSRLDIPAVAAAVVANNRTVAAPIFLGLDNGAEVFRIGDGGALTLTSGANVATLVPTQIQLAAVGGYEWAGRGGFKAPANGQYTLSNAATTAGVMMDVTADGTFHLKSRAGADSAILAASLFRTTTAPITATNGTNVAAFAPNMIGATNGPVSPVQFGWEKGQDSTGATIWRPIWK